MEGMSEIRRHPYGGDGGLWLEEFVRGSFCLCSAEDMPGSALEGAAPDCPYCGRPLRAASRQRDGRRHAIYTCGECRRALGRGRP